MKMNRLARLARVLVPLMLLAIAGVALAQVSASYNLSWHLLSGGGAMRASGSYRVDDSLGQMVVSRTTSANYALDPGFWYGVTGAAGAMPATPTPTATPVVAPGADPFEVDNTCGDAKEIGTTGVEQTRNFHVAGDEDWIKFYGTGGKSHIITLNNVGAKADAVIMLYSSCAQAPVQQGFNAFGPTVQLQWSAPASGWYFLRLLQNDPTVFGVADTDYKVSVSLDYTPPSPPRNIRVAAGDQKLFVQWRKPPEPDVAGYLLQAGPDCLHPNYSDDSIVGADNTYYEIPALINDTWYCVHIHAKDTSDNSSQPSVDTWGQPSITADPNPVLLTLTRPTTSTVYTTTVASLSVGGVVTDAGNNLSRARVRNLSNGVTLTNSMLTGGAFTFTVESLPLQLGDNSIQVTVYDLVNNNTTQSMTIHRNEGLTGVVVIVGGHNDANGLQTNIDYATNRAYRMFKDAGFYTTSIRYLSPSPQDADGDGVSDVYTHTTPSAIHAALQWASSQMGSGTPFFLYLMDHGLEDNYCANGCSGGGALSAANLDSWLNDMETAHPGSPVTVIIEACHSGSFIDRGGVGGSTQGISKSGRVVIASTGVSNNAFASAQGAYFSDAFFSSAAEGSNLRDAFNAARAAVLATGNGQTPWLDDNGDATANLPSDGEIAKVRYLASSFGAMVPHITAAILDRVGSTGTISVTVEQGDQAVKTVWAAVFAPSFQPPAGTTLDLGVPLVKLWPGLDLLNVYTATYSAFTEAGDYRIVVYATDNAGNQAIPKVLGPVETKIYLPLVMRNSASAVQGNPAALPSATARTSDTATPAPAATPTSTATPMPTLGATSTPALAPPVKATVTATAVPTLAPPVKATATATVTATITAAATAMFGRSPVPRQE